MNFQEIWIPGQLPGLNQLIDAAKVRHGKWNRYAWLKRKWMKHICMTLTGYHLRKVECAWIDFEWVCKNRRMDPDNIAAGKKFLIDSLVKVGMIPEDGWKNIAGWTDSFSIGANPGVIMRIKNVKRRETK